jgi:PPOX class probable FMN-dependent enzyme
MAKIDGVDGLRAIYKQPSGRAVEKQLAALDRHCRRFIELSPFLLISTQGPDGLGDLSPKGDAPGFVAVLDDNTIAIPDRLGNNRLDTLENLTRNPGVGLIFLVPGVDETCRLNGTAEIRDDEDLLNRFVVNRKPPATVIVVSVKEAYLHCAKALMRAKLWDTARHVERSTLPSIGEMIRDQRGLGGAAESQDEMVEYYRKNLY